MKEDIVTFSITNSHLYLSFNYVKLNNFFYFLFFKISELVLNIQTERGYEISIFLLPFLKRNFENIRVKETYHKFENNGNIFWMAKNYLLDSTYKSAKIIK